MRQKLGVARDRARLEQLAEEIGGRASVGSPAEVVAFGEVVVFSVPWSAIPEALDQAGSLREKIIIDTTNQFGTGPMPATGQTAAQFNAARMPGARYTKSFNTLTSGFQAAAAGRTGAERVVQWICGDDAEANQVVAQLVDDTGFEPVDLGGTAQCAVMEAPRRPGAVYGEEYRSEDARAVAAALRAGGPSRPHPTTTADPIAATLRWSDRSVYRKGEVFMTTTMTLARELYEGFQRAEFERWDAIIDDDVLLNSPAGFGQRGLSTLKEWAATFVRIAKRIDLVDEHLALDSDGNGRGFITFNIHWKHDVPFFDLAPTGREGTSVETLLLTLTNHIVTRIDVADNSVDLILYLWQRNWPYPHNIDPEPLVVGVDRLSRTT